MKLIDFPSDLQDVADQLRYLIGKDINQFAIVFIDKDNVPGYSWSILNGQHHRIIGALYHLASTICSACLDTQDEPPLGTRK